MAFLPDDLLGWIEKVQLFHGQKLYIDELRRSMHYPGFRIQGTQAPQAPRDPNTMDVDVVRLKKLTPQEQAKCMREGRCFKCRKTSHDAKNYRTKTDVASNPPCSSQQILYTEETPISIPSTKPKPSPFMDYAQSLGKSKEELLQTLKLCYKELDEEVKAAKTFKELQDF